MYQYFPHKQALLYALNERYLDMLAERVEAVCLEQHGKATATMVASLIEAYWEAKTERSDITRVLYSSAVELNNEALVEAFAARMDRATAAMLASAPNAMYADLNLVNATILSVVFGTVRNVFERNMPLTVQANIRKELVAMCLSYLEGAGG
jgi:AcrR family transcriptional regulator